MPTGLPAAGKVGHATKPLFAPGPTLLSVASGEIASRASGVLPRRREQRTAAEDSD